VKQFADDEGWSRSTRRALAVTVLLGVVAMTLVLALPLLSGRLYVNDDLRDLHIPIRHVYQAALRAGDSFLWAPQFMTGFDLHGEGQAAMYHPIHLLLYRTLSLQSALSTELLFSYVTMFPGMCFFLLRLGLPLPAALFGGLTFTFSGFNLLHFMHLNIVFVVAHIPWLLAAIDVVLRTTSRRALALGQLAVSLATGSQLLAGHPQFVWYSLLAELAFVAWRLRNGGRWRRIPVLGWATILGVLLGAIQVLPTLHALAGSDRGSPSRDFPLVFSLERANLIQLWSQGLSGHRRRTLDDRFLIGVRPGIRPAKQIKDAGRSLWWCQGEPEDAEMRRAGRISRVCADWESVIRMIRKLGLGRRDRTLYATYFWVAETDRSLAG